MVCLKCKLENGIFVLINIFKVYLKGLKFIKFVAAVLCLSSLLFYCCCCMSQIEKCKQKTKSYWLYRQQQWRQASRENIFAYVFSAFNYKNELIKLQNTGLCWWRQSDCSSTRFGCIFFFLNCAWVNC